MSAEYIELNMANYDEDQVCQLNDWSIWAYGELERLQKERAERFSRDCTIDEVDELMDCIHSDHSFEDLDKHTPADMQTTTGSTIAWLMHRCHAAEKELLRLSKPASSGLDSCTDHQLSQAELLRTAERVITKHDGGYLSPIKSDSMAIEELREAVKKVRRAARQEEGIPTS